MNSPDSQPDPSETPTSPTPDEEACRSEASCDSTNAPAATTPPASTPAATTPAPTSASSEESPTGGPAPEVSPAKRLADEPAPSPTSSAETHPTSPTSGRWLARYLRTRFPLRVSVPLTLGVLLATWAPLRPRSSLSLMLDVALAAIAILALRLWDDLADRRRDATNHPQRVLCRAPSIAPFVWTLLLAFAVEAVLLATARVYWSLAGFAVLIGLLGAWYGWRAKLGDRPILNYHVVLLKYPALAVMLGLHELSDLSLALLGPAAALYVVLCIYEVVHDPLLRRSRLAWLCAGVEALILIAIVFDWVRNLSADGST